jgi:hypothetical protein
MFIQETITPSNKKRKEIRKYNYGKKENSKLTQEPVAYFLLFQI